MKLIEYSTESNDIYFLKSIQNSLIINDNYNGFMILDDNLKVKKRVKVMEDFIIYMCFITNDRILFHCPDSESLVYYNMNNEKLKIISLNEFSDIIFSDICWLDTSNVILKSNKNFLFQVNIDDQTLNMIDKEKLIGVNLSDGIQDQNSLKMMHDIFNEKSKDYFHQIETLGNGIAYISENRLILNHRDKERKIEVEDGDMFISGQFMEKEKQIYFYLLQKSKCVPLISKILKIPM